jgi:RNA polymerase sigma-70 factor (ECF subfamily)
MDPAMVLPNPVTTTAAALDFATLVGEHQAMVFSLAYHFLGERAAAEELAQDVFLQLFRHLGRLQSPAHAVFWLRRVTANRCIDEARRRQRRPEVKLEEMPEPVAAAESVDPLVSGRLRRLVESLPEKARMMVVLRYQEDMDPEDIAELMNMPLNTVKSQLQRALTMLRQKVGNMKWER